MKKFFILFLFIFLYSLNSFADDTLLFKTPDNVTVYGFHTGSDSSNICKSSTDSKRFVHNYDYVSVSTCNHGFLIHTHKILNVHNSSQYSYEIYPPGGSAGFIYYPSVPDTFTYNDSWGDYYIILPPVDISDDGCSSPLFGNLYFNTDDKGSISAYFHPLDKSKFTDSDLIRCNELPDSPPDPNPDCPDVSMTTRVSSNVDDINYLADGATPYMGVVSSVYDENFGRQSVSSTSLTVYAYGGDFYHWVHLDVPYSVSIDNTFRNWYSGGLSWTSCQYNGRCVGYGFTNGYLSNLVYYNPNLSETWSSFQAFLNPECDYDVSLSRSGDNQVSFSGSQHINQTTKYNTICESGMAHDSEYIENISFVLPKHIDNVSVTSKNVFSNSVENDILSNTKALNTTLNSDNYTHNVLGSADFDTSVPDVLSDNISLLSFSPFSFSGSLSLSDSSCFFSSSVLGRDVSISFCDSHIVSFLNVIGAFVVLFSSLLFFFIVFK